MNLRGIYNKKILHKNKVGGVLGMYIKAITTDKGFDEVENEWRDFDKKVNNQNITSTYVWQRTWWMHFKNYEKGAFGRDKQLCLLILYDGENKLKAIAPFCEMVRRVWGFEFKTIEFVAQHFGATYLDIISDKLSKEECGFLFSWLKRNRKYDFIELKYIPEFTSNFDLREKNITVLSACPEITSESYSSVRNCYYGKNLKHKLNRINNKVKREGINLNSSLLSSNEILSRFSDIKGVSISKELSLKHSIYRDIQKEAFVKDLIKSFAENAKCSVIECNWKTVAYNLGFKVGDKYYAWDAAYNRNEKELETLSLGNLNYDYLIRRMLDTGINNICLCTGVDAYKLKFSRQLVRIHTYLERGNTLKGIVLYFLRTWLCKRTAKAFERNLEICLQKD